MADTTSPPGGTEPALKKPRLIADAPPSLLTLGDPLGSILAQGDVVSVCRLEQTCKALGIRANSHVRKRWDRLDASVPAKLRSRVGDAGKERFQRYYSAHIVAQNLEPLLERQLCMLDEVEELCADIYCEPENFELFLRLSRKVGNEFYILDPNHDCEGFVEFRSHSSAVMDPIRPFCGRSIHFRLADYAPPRLKQALKYVAERKGVRCMAERGDQAFVENEVKDMAMTLLAVHKETGKTELLTGVVGFRWAERGGSHLETASITRFTNQISPIVRTTVGKMADWVSNDGECKVMIY